MTEAQLQTIEQELGRRLPEDYRSIIREFGGQIDGLFDDPDEVIQATRFPMDASDYDSENWKPSYIAIGDSGAGDLYLLDTAFESSPVYVLSHEDLSITAEWTSIAAFIATEQAWREKKERESQKKAEQERERGRNRRVFLLALFAMIGLPLVMLPLLIFGPRAGIPLWLSCVLGLAACLFLARTMVRAIRGGIYY
jgi:hypothetical protein